MSRLPVSLLSWLWVEPNVLSNFSRFPMVSARKTQLVSAKDLNQLPVIAVDGWGVPVVGMPVTRLSHDYFTHLTSLPLGAGEVNFVAHPPVAHLNLWGQPESVMGFEVSRCQGAKGVGMPMTAGQFLRRVLQAEWNGASSWRHAAANAAHKSG